MNNSIKNTIDTLEAQLLPSKQDLKALLLYAGPEENQYLTERADAVRHQYYGSKVYLRGLIEFTNHCRNDCYYCGIRRSHKEVQRYRLKPKEILQCCETGYALGLRTFVLQGGEDPYWTDEKLVPLVASVRKEFPDCALTLSVGERSRESYQNLYDAGADRYLLRHETASDRLYEALHPEEMNFAARHECLFNLKTIGYQVGCGFMVGTPGQTVDDIIGDIRFTGEFNPHMAGIGPFIPAKGTPFENEAAGSPRMTLKLISILRLLIPDLLLPATTALGTAAEDGRLRGIKAGANVIMPNITPASVREHYCLYNKKPTAGAECAEGLETLKAQLSEIGFEAVTDRGDHISCVK